MSFPITYIQLTLTVHRSKVIDNVCQSWKKLGWNRLSPLARHRNNHKQFVKYSKVKNEQIKPTKCGSKAYKYCRCPRYEHIQFEIESDYTKNFPKWHIV